MLNKQTTYLQQITKVYESNSNPKVVLETVDTVPLQAFESGKYIRLSKDYLITIRTEVSKLSNKKFITAVVATYNEGTYPNTSRVSVILSLKEGKLVASPIEVAIDARSCYPLDFSDIDNIREMFSPLLLNQGTTYDEYNKMAQEEYNLYISIEDEKKKIIRKEAREKARLIAAAQLQKERQVTPSETPRKRK
jgi:hypothetical protein